MISNSDTRWMAYATSLLVGMHAQTFVSPQMAFSVFVVCYCVMIVMIHYYFIERGRTDHNSVEKGRTESCGDA
jgi:hypothetical protein